MPDKHTPASVIRRAWLDMSLTSTEAAAQIGLSRPRLQARAKALGLPARPQGRRPVTDAALLTKLWQAGVPAAAIAGLFRCNPLTIGHTARRIGLKPRQAGGHKRGPTIAQFLDDVQARRMACTAAQEQAAMISAEMADGTGKGGQLVGQKHAGAV